MHQATLELAPPPDEAADRTGFDIGWDHARHGLVPPAEGLLAGTPVNQGWMSGRAVFGRRVLATRRTTRLWLALRLHAWRHGIAFEGQQVTAHHLAQIHVATCPVLRLPLGGAAGDATAAVVERINPDAGYAVGNLVVMSRQAQHSAEGVDAQEAQRRARMGELTGEPVRGLPAAAWWRIAALRSFATPLPFHRAAQLPLAVLPPNRVPVLNAVQGLQERVTLQFAAPGWSARTRALAALLPEQSQRHDFNLFVGALAPRVLEAGTDPQALRRALEDAWLHERVQRRWQHFVLGLGEAGVEDLLKRASAMGRATLQSLKPAPEQSSKGGTVAACDGVVARPAMAATMPSHQPPPWIRTRAGAAARPAP